MKLTKLIITIPEDKYKYIQGLKQGNTDYATTQILYHAVKKGTKAIPSAEPKVGHWIELENWLDVGKRVKCSECGQVFVVGDDVSRKFCSNCGARMVEPQESKNNKCPCYYCKHFEIEGWSHCKIHESSGDTKCSDYEEGMTEFIILSGADILTLCNDKPVTVYVDKKPYVLCTDEYFEKQRNEPQESEVNNG